MPSPTTYRGRVDLSNIPAHVTAARERTGREVGAILADYACCAITHQDLCAEIDRVVETSKAEAREAGQKVAALRIASESAQIKAAGVLIRSTKPSAEAQAVLDAHEARVKEGTKTVEALAAHANALGPLLEELLCELGRAGVPRADVKGLLDKAVHRRVTKAPA